jgi:hypothetical protein
MGHRLQKIENGLVDYTGMDAGLFDIKGEPLSFPINIAPGQAMSFVQQTQIMLPKQVYDELSSKHLDSKPVNTKELMLSLGENGVDYWGNTVKVSQYEGKAFSYQGPSLSSGLKDPAFRLVFSTARGSSIPARFSYYGVFQTQ